MIDFNAYFYKYRIRIEGGKEYKTNEILLAYLSFDFPNLDEMLATCKSYERTLHFPEANDDITDFDKHVQKAIMFYNRIDGIIEELPPYNDIGIKHNQLFELLNEYSFFFKNEPGFIDWDHYHYPDYNDHFYTNQTYSDHEPDMCDEALQFNHKLKIMAANYRTFIEDCIRVQKIYKPFLERIHYRNEYIQNEETAGIFRTFIEEQKDKIRTYDKLESSGNMSLTYTPLALDNQLIMCEKYHFNTIGGLLYIDLFKGLENHFIPRKCDLCGRYFLLEATAYSAYCTRPIKGKNGKNCRDLGHRKKYADKVNSDPILLTYTKAYKAHYARYLKKRMTQSEFREWADYALELREKVYNNELTFEKYQELIRI